MMAFHPKFPPFLGRTPNVASNMDSDIHSVTSAPAALPPQSSMNIDRSYHSQRYGPGPSSDTSVMYHPSGRRMSPPFRGFPPREIHPLPRPSRQSWTHDHIEPYSTAGRALGSSTMSDPDYGHFSSSRSSINGPFSLGPIGPPPRAVSVSGDWEMPVQISPDSLPRIPDSSQPMDTFEPPAGMPKRRATESIGSGKHHSQRKSSNRDEFDGPHQLLERPSPESTVSNEWDLPTLPTNLDEQEQDQILCEVNDRLSRCAFDFVAKYQFPIPVEQDKRQVKVPADREWTEWVYLLKRLATKRRIPARVLYNGQIKQFVTVLENSLEMRHAAKHQSRPVKDDRNVLQLISAGTQVAKILKDAPAMEYLDRLYIRTERQIFERRRSRERFSNN